MNCSDLLSATGWDCRPVGESCILATAPFSLGDDGELAKFYLAQPSADSFYITDASDTARHVSAHGGRITKSRVDAVLQHHGVRHATIDGELAIVAQGRLIDMQEALWDAVKLALGLSSNTENWQPKFAQTKFKTLVYEALELELGKNRIVTEAKVVGASGNQIEFPFAVRREDSSLCYVQPIGLNRVRAIDWPAVYQAHGKFFDLKRASEISNRLAILESGAASSDYGHAVTLLAHATRVRTLEGTLNWREVFA
ncbi:DUF1828 domain-containing protein [Cupriavidus necator]